MFAEALDADVEPKSALDVATGLSLLVSADEAGLVIISAGGTFPLQATQVFAGGVTQPSSPLNHSVNLSGNLSEALQGKSWTPDAWHLCGSPQTSAIWLCFLEVLIRRLRWVVAFDHHWGSSQGFHRLQSVRQIRRCHIPI